MQGMRRWHSEEVLMERQRRLDLADHRRSAMRGHYDGVTGEWKLPNPDDFQCECRNGKGMFRKHKQWACSCYRCRAESWHKKYERRKARCQAAREMSKVLLEENFSLA
jgi:hypothetical protein